MVYRNDFSRFLLSSQKKFVDLVVAFPSRKEFVDLVVAFSSLKEVVDLAITFPSQEKNVISVLVSRNVKTNA
jgi:hypothetical protein